MSRYAATFKRLQQKKERAFVPFIVIGDPDIETSLGLMHELVQSGADILELGFPFSDPVADGPRIQEAMQRGLEAGATPVLCFRTIERFRERDPDTPVGLLVYANLVYRKGLHDFYSRCARAGVDSVLVPDVPLEESASWTDAATAAGVDPVLICPPNATEAGIRQIAAMARGYTYLLSRAGVTGTAIAAGRPARWIVDRLAAAGAPPPLLGFGISQPEQVRAALEAGAAGVICGSAIVQRVALIRENGEGALKDLRRFVSEMKDACRGIGGR